ncbi:hypothetical protein E1162_01695 [Rhodobacteraceae bacterium RKSG542]|uniref:hypothetical protein n=1 Tax=Pseudovibrio flavus TaxID=2529854 RepID=UPI0012BCE8A2|nr:hypothetical protein [Pseudovibrio flavus]MTI15946.1 hypothetical protein [Pseudovibrio flavus]
MASDATEEVNEKDILSFHETGRVLKSEELVSEFQLIKEKLKKCAAKDFEDVARGSGTHLLKLLSPRTGKDQAVLRFVDEGSNETPEFVPSTNAPLIPIQKVLYRPLQVEGRPSKSLVEHILNPDDGSSIVLDAFAQVFGGECLEVVKDVLLNPLAPITTLPPKEFPIVFVPNPAGGDLQVTPVSPARAYMGAKEVVRQKIDEKRQLVPFWHLSKQAISAKPQNISGKLGGPRMRFHAALPKMLDQYDAQLFRYAKGGAFPRFNIKPLQDDVVRYARLAEQDEAYSNRDIRRGLDSRADRVVMPLLDFIATVKEDAMAFAAQEELPAAPSPIELLLKQPWPKDVRPVVERALNGPHFRSRLANWEKQK